MGKITARDCEIFADPYNLSGDHNSATLTMSVDSIDATGFGNDDRQYLSDGLQDVELSLGGFWNWSASATDEVFYNLLGGSAYYGFYPESASAGEQGREFRGILSDYAIEEGAADAAAVSATVGGSTGMYFGNSLGFSKVSGTASGSVGYVDFAASVASTFAIWRVVEFEGTDISACFQDSTDNATYVTRLAFGAKTDVGISSSTSNSADQYRRLKYEMTGAGASALIMAFSGSKI